jgi:prepilin-type N-terminal cleavage/methylation domain-containing protein
MEGLKKVMNHLPETAAKNRGFTLIEIIAVLVVIGIITVVVISNMTSNSATSSLVQVNIIKNQIRYAQSMAMKRGEIWGIKCDPTDYWLFRTNDPDTPANQIVLPDEDDAKVTLASKEITMTTFTVFFDANGRPFTAYTNDTINTPISAGNPLSITVNSIPAGAGATFGVTPETGFIP